MTKTRNGAYYEDPFVGYALEEIYGTYGDQPALKYKSLNKFGRVDMSSTDIKYTIATFGSTLTNNETYTTANTIDTLVSDSSVDTMNISLEGHRYDASNELEFVTTNCTLTGQTPSTFPGMARLTRMYVTDGTFASPSSNNVGTIYGVNGSVSTAISSSGIPQTPASLHIAIAPGKNQSEKCATTISKEDYWIITNVTAALSRDSNIGAWAADVDVEIRRQGGVFRPIGAEITLVSSGTSLVELAPKPYFIVPPNSDVRLVATASTVDVKLTGNINGVLAGMSTVADASRWTK